LYYNFFALPPPPTCFCPDGEGAVRMVPDGRSLKVRVTGVDFGQ